MKLVPWSPDTMPADDAYDVSMTQHGSYRRISYSSAVRIVAYDGCSSVILPNAEPMSSFGRSSE